MAACRIGLLTLFAVPVVSQAQENFPSDDKIAVIKSADPVSESFDVIARKITALTRETTQIEQRLTALQSELGKRAVDQSRVQLFVSTKVPNTRIVAIDLQIDGVKVIRSDVEAWPLLTEFPIFDNHLPRRTHEILLELTALRTDPRNQFSRGSHLVATHSYALNIDSNSAAENLRAELMQTSDNRLELSINQESQALDGEASE